jgi:hypothetical protein
MAFQLAAVTGMDAARMNKRIRFALIMVVSLFAASANGAPMAYSVNSDSGKISTDDSLYAIDLTTGSNQHCLQALSTAPIQKVWHSIPLVTSGVLMMNP